MEKEAEETEEKILEDRDTNFFPLLTKRKRVVSKFEAFYLDMLSILDELDGVFSVCILENWEDRAEDFFLHDAVFSIYINHYSRFYLESIFIDASSKNYFITVDER